MRSIRQHHHSAKLLLSLALTVAVSLTACSEQQPAVQKHTFGLAEVISFDTAIDDDTVYLLIAGKKSPDADTIILRYSHSADGGQTWAPAVTLGQQQPEPYGLHIGNGVQLAVTGKLAMAAWPSAGTGYMGSGPLITAISTDAGAHWIPGSNPADDGNTRGHGFADVIADAQGNMHIVWLDSRNGQQALYAAMAGDASTHWTANENIDAATCECCWNTLTALTDGGVAVLYRDIDPRDMALAVITPGGSGWQQRGRVGHFNWHFPGCPHAGGALEATSQGLHAIVYTGKTGAAGLYHLFSADAGKHWRGPTQLSGPEGSRADLASGPNNRLAAVWADRGDGGTRVALAQSADGGQHWQRQPMPEISIRSGTRPRIEQTVAGWAVLWITPTNNGSALVSAQAG